METAGVTAGQTEAAGTGQAQTEGDYTPSEAEKKYYHVQLEKPYYDRRTGQKLSKPFVQKMTVPEYNRLTGKKSGQDKSNAEMLGYTVAVLWNPKANA